jgi:hypothetical protein
MNQHGRLKVAIRKHLCNVGQVHLNLITAAGVFGVIGFDLNGPADRV